MFNCCTTYYQSFRTVLMLKQHEEKWMRCGHAVNFQKRRSPKAEFKSVSSVRSVSPVSHPHHLLHSMQTMDIIQSCLSYAPLPYLEKVFSLFSFVYGSIQQARHSKKQLHTMNEMTAHLLLMIDKQFKENKLSQDQNDGTIAELCQCVIVVLVALSHWSCICAY